MDRKQNPFVSIIVPTYNLSEFIAETLDSIQEQNFQDFEVLLIDDGSTDNTEVIVRNYQSSDSRFILLKNTHRKGPSGARNTGIEFARGQWIAFLDGDDLWTPDSLSMRLEVLERYPEAQYIGSNYTCFHNNVSEVTKSQIELNTVWNKYFGNALRSGAPVCLQEPLKYFLESVLIHTGTVLVEKKIIKQLGGFDENLRSAEDHQLWLKIAANVKSYLFIPRILMLYRQRDGSLTHSKKALYHDTPEAYQALLYEPGFEQYRYKLKTEICHFIKMNSYFYRENNNYQQALKWSLKLIICAPLSKTSWKNFIASCLLK